MPFYLPRDSFLALAAIGWADGVLDADEGAALLRVAREASLSPEDISAVEQATRAPISLGAIETKSLARADRVLVYALATWLSRIDGRVSQEEREGLRLLGDRLGLPDGVRSRASAAAFEVAQLPEGDRPERYDFQALKARLLSKLGDVEAE